MTKPLSPAARVVAALAKKNVRLKFKDLAKAAKLKPADLAQALPEARELRPDLTFGKYDRTYWLANTPTWYSNQTDLSLKLPNDGEIGLISDTHLGSVAERLDIVHEAYDVFSERGIECVFHCGDLTDGWKEYRNHVNFVKVHGDQAQAAYAMNSYPKRKGLITYVIGGNHDDSFAHSKIDRLSLITHGFHHEGKEYDPREDIKYVGQYSHYFIFPNEVRMQMLHPRGNQAYSFSYKQQKRAEAMRRDTRPEIQVSGHYHTFCHTWHDGTHMIALPGVQDETEYFVRLGLPRSVGFAVLRYTIRRGQLTAFSPEIFMR